MQADKTTLYYIGTGPLPESTGGGTTQILQPALSFWDRLMGRPLPRATVAMTVNPAATPAFTDISGNTFTPSTLRLLGHELGHGFSYLQGGYVGYRVNYDAAIRFENSIARQLNPNAPMRSVSDHRFGF